MDKHLHIVTHDVPWPADYGGVTDLFYKIKALHKLGIKIHLHCYTSGRPERRILNDYCESVKYYKRKKNLSGFSFSIPYIVRSRSNDALLKELLQDDYPVLLEGIHCTYFLQNEKLKGRKVFVRLHNVEHRYYRQLAKHEINLFKKTYFLWESMLLKKYEKLLAVKAVFLAVSKEDATIYLDELHAKETYFLPVFLPWNEINILPGKGNFCLYHGNLSVNENEKAVDWLIADVFNDLDIPLIVAGKRPPLPLQAFVISASYATIVVDPTENEMQDLIRKAQLHIIPSFNNTGVKLKLLNALYNGRYCIVNKEAAEGSEMLQYCITAKTPEEFKNKIRSLFEKSFTEEQIRERKAALKKIYDNEKNGRQLITWLY